MEPGILTVLIVEDYAPMRGFLVGKLSSQERLRIVGEVGDGAEAVDKAKQLKPDLVLLDIGLPTLNGIEVCRRIRDASPTTKILFVSENSSSDIAEEAFRCGGLGYVVKSDAGTDLLPAVQAVIQGKRFLSASLTGHLLVAATLIAMQALGVSWLLLM